MTSIRPTSSASSGTQTRHRPEQTNSRQQRSSTQGRPASNTPAYANARYQETRDRQQETVANARFSDFQHRTWRPTQNQETLASARYHDYLKPTKDKGKESEAFANARYPVADKSNNPFRASDRDRVKPTDDRADKRPTDDKDKPDDKKPDNPNDKDKPNPGWGERISSFVKDLAGKYLGKTNPNSDLPKNLLLGSVSGVQQKVGYMDVGPRAWTCFGKALKKALGSSDSLVGALDKIAGKNVTLGQTPFHWKAKTLANGEKMEDSLFNVSEKNKGKNKVFFIGSHGGPEPAFKNTLKGISKMMKDKFGASTKIINGYNKGGEALSKAYKEIKDYAEKHPDEHISVVTYAEGHGNTQGGNGKQGSGSGIHNGLPGSGEKGFRKIQKMLANIKNIGLFNMISCCHAGAFADKPNVA